MRNFYNKGGPTLTKAQKTLPDALKKLEPAYKRLYVAVPD